MKKLLAALLCLCALFAVAGCGSGDASSEETGGRASSRTRLADRLEDVSSASAEESEIAASVPESEATEGPAVVTAVDGEAHGKVGDTIELYWYDLIVRSAAEVDSYAGYEPEEGYKLIDVVIYFESVFWDVSPMSDAEYIIRWGRGDANMNWCLDALDDTMMPGYWEIEPNEKIEYHLVFEVPSDASGFTLEFEASFEETPDEVTYFFVDLGL